MRPLAAVLAFVVAACGGSGPSPSGAPTPAASPSTGQAAAPIRRNANLITAEEIGTLGGRAETALQVIEQLRPAMLRPRGGATSGAEPLATYVDGVKVGDAEGLRSVQSGMIREIRYLNPNDATQRFGTGHTSGAIVIVTKR